MESLLENKFYKYFNKLQSELIRKGKQIRLLLNSMESNAVTAEEYAAIVLERASKVLLDVFNEDDDVMVYIEAKEADLIENYDEVLEENISMFYSQFIKNENVETYTKTFSVYIDENGEDALTDYVHVDLQEENGEKRYVEVIVNHIISGKFNDILLPGLLAGKCNSLEGYPLKNEDSLDDDFVIKDKILIVNKSKDLVYTLYNDIVLDLICLDINTIRNIVKKYKDFVIS